MRMKSATRSAFDRGSTPDAPERCNTWSGAVDDGQLVRERVAVPFPWARSALVCFASYLNPAAPLSTETPDPRSGWIARYAWTSRLSPNKKDAKGERQPTDYHKVLLKRLRHVEAQLHEQFGEFESRAYVDTGPVVERSLAVAAGLGWIGKNTCLIHPRLGSFGFLAVLLTSLDVSEQAAPALVSDRCGTCTRCIEACPTDALIAPYQMDARRCISYLTIEHKGPIDEALMPGWGGRFSAATFARMFARGTGKRSLEADHSGYRA